MNTQFSFLKVVSAGLTAVCLFSQFAVAASPDRVICKNDQVLFSTRDGNLPVHVREAKGEDFDFILRLNRSAFPHDNASDKLAKQWIDAYREGKVTETARYYVISFTQADGKESGPVGYAFWALDGGFNPRSTVRQNQLAIEPSYRALRFGEALARLSLLQFQDDVLSPLGYKVGHIYTTAGSEDASALEMYEKALGLQNLGDVGPVYGKTQYGKSEYILVNNDVPNFLTANPIDQLFGP